MKFSSEGSEIQIETYYYPDLELFACNVIDNGTVEIDADEVPKLFQPYTTLRAANESNLAGRGLGLYTAKQLCEKMGGEITF